MCIHTNQNTDRLVNQQRKQDPFCAPLYLVDSCGELLASVIVKDARNDKLVLAAANDLKHWHKQEIQDEYGSFVLEEINNVRKANGQNTFGRGEFIDARTPPTSAAPSIQNHTDNDDEFARLYREGQTRIELEAGAEERRS